MTFDLYKEGLTPEQIAEKRGIQLMTVFSHLSQLFSEGKEVDLAQFVEAGIIERVKGAFEKNERKFELKPIFDSLDEEVPYHEIRIALTLILKDE